MYGLNEIVAMNAFVDLSPKDRVSSECLSVFNQLWNDYPGIRRIPKAMMFTHGEWEARQQKESEHESASNE